MAELSSELTRVATELTDSTREPDVLDLTALSTMKSSRARLVSEVPKNPRIGDQSDIRFHSPDDYVVLFKPENQNRVCTGTRQKSELELKLGKVDQGGKKESKTLEGRFTSVSKRQVDCSKSKDSKDRKSESFINVKSPEKRESDLGKRLCQYDFDSEINDDEDKRKVTCKDRIKTISAKLIHPCIQTIKMVYEPSGEEGSSPDSSSSAKTSVVITEETDLSDENQTSVGTNSQSDKNVTARKLSSGNITLSDAEFDKCKDQLECPEENKKTRNADRSQDSARPIESELKRKSSVPTKITTKECKPISEECSEIQTSEDNLSPLEDDDDNLAAPTHVKASRECSEGSQTTSEEALPSLEENLLAPEGAVKKKKRVKMQKEKKVDYPNKAHGRRKHGLTSSEGSITPLTNAKSESQTDTKESWIDFRSDSTTASREGLTSSEESKISPPAPVELLPAHVMSKTHLCQTAEQSENMDEQKFSKKLSPQIEESDSEDSFISGYTDSSSTMEIERISERLLPIGGTLTLIKGKSPSERSTTSGSSSISSLIESLTWEKRNVANKRPNEATENRDMSIHRNKDTQQESMTRVTKFDDIKSQTKRKPSSDSDTSSEETHMRVLCEQVIKETTSPSKDIFTTAHYCIDSITFGIRRSLSEETLYSIEADTQAHREKNTFKIEPHLAKSNVFSTKACDACTFLILLRTLTIRERVVHYTFRKMDVCVIHNIGLSRQSAHIHRRFLKKMPLCEFCMFPSVEKMILQLVQSKRGVLMHIAEHLPPIYVIFPPYAENNRTIGRVVYLRKKKISGYSERARIRVMMADRYILFPKFHDSSIWGKNTKLKRHDTPSKRVVLNVKTRNVPAKMDDIPELNESIVEEPRPIATVENKALIATPTKKRPSKRKVKKCVLKKWCIQRTGNNTQANRKNGSSSDESIFPNFNAGSESASANVTHNELSTLNNKRRRCVLKKWCVKLSPKQKRKMTHKVEWQRLATIKSSNVSESVVADRTAQTKTELTSATSYTSDTSQLLDHNQIDGVVLVRKKRPWWKCPKKKSKKRSAEDSAPIMSDLFKNFLHPTYQQPLLSYTIESRKTGQTESRVLTSQDVMSQRLAYHHIRELTCRTDSTTQTDEIETIKPSLTDLKSREYEERRTIIRGSRQFVPKASDQIVVQAPIDKVFVDIEKSPDDKLSTSRQAPESILDLSKIDLNQIDYHFENCPIIQKGDTPFKKFLKLQQVYKTTDFEDSWVEYHVENCSYFMIDGTTITDLKFVHLVLAEKKDGICDCAEKLIKGGNIYHRHKSSQTFHHDLCLLFPKQLESGDIDLQGLFNPYIPSREFDEEDIIRFYFISKRMDTKDARLIDYCDVPINKFGKVQQNIKITYNILRNEIGTTTNLTQTNAKHDINIRSYEKSPSIETASTSIQPSLKTYHPEDTDDILPKAVCPPLLELAEYKRLLTPPRVDSESEDSITVYSLEDCLIYANKHITDDVAIDDCISLLPDSFDIKDNNAASMCQPGPSGQKLLRPSTSLQMMSSNQTDIDNSQQNLTKDFDTQRLNLQSQDNIRVPRPVSPSQMGPVRQGTRSEGFFIQDDRLTQRIKSQENLTEVCTCNWFESMKIYENVVHYLDRNFKKTHCAYHRAIYEEELAKQRQNLSQRNFSESKEFSLFGEEFTSNQEGVSQRHTEPSRRQSSYPPFQRTSTPHERASSRDIMDSEPNVYAQNYNLDAVVSPTWAQEGLRQGIYSGDKPFQQSHITDQRTRSHGDLTSGQSRRRPEYIGTHHANQLCMMSVYIQKERGDERIRSQENINEGDCARQSYSTPQTSLRDQRVSPQSEDRLYSEDLAQGRATYRGARPRANSSEDKCPHLWKSWREGPAPF